MGEPLFVEGKRWCADENFDDASMATKSSRIKAATFSWFTAMGCGENLGLASVGKLCVSSEGTNTNINEKYKTAVQSAYVCIWN